MADSRADFGSPSGKAGRSSTVPAINPSTNIVSPTVIRPRLPWQCWVLTLTFGEVAIAAVDRLKLEVGLDVGFGVAVGR